MKYLPMFFDMTKANCLIVGAGKVGFRKTRTLLNAHVKSIKVVDPKKISEEWAEFSNKPITFEQRKFQESDLDDIDFVFVQSSNKALNKQIVKLCRMKRVACNIADAPDDCDFIMPAVVEKGQICIALSTGGQSPALAKKLAQKVELELEARFTVGYNRQIELLGKLRTLILNLNLPSSTNAKYFRELCSDDITDLLANSNKKACVKAIQEIIPAELHDKIEGIIDELC